MLCFGNLWVTCFYTKKLHIFTSLSLTVFLFYEVTHVPKRIFCHLNHAVSFIPPLGSHGWLICFAGEVADASSILNYMG